MVVPEAWSRRHRQVGEGKSVLLKHIIGLMAQDSGDILFQGQPLSAMSRDERRAFRRRCSYMFQNMALFDSMTVSQNIALPLRETLHQREAEADDRCGPWPSAWS